MTNAVRRALIPVTGVLAATLISMSPSANAEPPGCNWNTDAGVQACLGGGGSFDAGLNGNGDTYDPGPSVAAPGAPTITNPKGTRAVIMADVYALICNDLDANGVSVDSITRIHNVLIDDPQYGYAARDAGLNVAYAVQNTCPQYKGALMRATEEALAR